MGKQGEKVVQEYLESKGLNPKKIKESTTKTPDFEVYHNGKLLFYCEEKTLKYDNFYKEENVEGKNDSSRNSISTHIRKAQKQFIQVNPDHKYPNVLVFNNNNTLINPNDLFTTLTGNAFTEDGRLIKLFNSIGRIEENIEIIDLYIWFDNNRFTNQIWSGLNENHMKTLKVYLT